MTPSIARSDDFLCSLARFLDNDLTSGELVSFNETLRTDDSSRELFVSYCTQSRSIQKVLDSASDLSLVESPQNVGPKVQPLSKTAGQRFAQAIDWRVHRVRFLSVVSLLTILAIAGFAYLLTPPPSNLTPTTSYFGNSDFVTIARITGREDVIWSDAMEPMPANSPLFSEDQLLLEEGLLEITFGEGAVVVLEGPCRFTVDTPTHGQLDRGRLTSMVPVDAIGFTVATPLVEIVDLGTSFGVAVDKEKQTEVHVLSGRVKAYQLDDAGNRIGEASYLARGEAMQFSAEGESSVAASIDFSTDTFAERLSTPPVVGYWRFEEGRADEPITSALSHGNSLDMVASASSGAEGILRYSEEVPGSQIIEGESGRIRENTLSLYTRRRTPDLSVNANGNQHVVVGETDSIRQMNQLTDFTFEIFIKADTEDREGYHVIARKRRGGAGASWSLTLGPDGRVYLRVDSEFTAGNDELGFNQSVGTPEAILSRVDDERWHHLAVRYLSAISRFDLFLDHRHVGSLIPEGSQAIIYDDGPLTIGGRSNGNGWNGWLDEPRLSGRAIPVSDFLRVLEAESDSGEGR